MNRGSFLLFAAVVLAACQSAPSSAPVPAPKPTPIVQAVKQVCPSFHEWSAADLKILGGTLAAIPEASILNRMALDWRRYYGDAKACNGAQGKP